MSIRRVKIVSTARAVHQDLVSAAVVAQPLAKRGGKRDWKDVALATVAGGAVWFGVTILGFLVIKILSAVLVSLRLMP
jgi:hypothetical protein